MNNDTDLRIATVTNGFITSTHNNSEVGVKGKTHVFTDAASLGSFCETWARQALPQPAAAVTQPTEVLDHPSITDIHSITDELVNKILRCNLQTEKGISEVSTLINRALKKQAKMTKGSN